MRGAVWGGSFFSSMGKISDIKNHLLGFTVQKQVEDIAKIIRNHEDDIVDLNRNQMMLGEDSGGGIIGRYSNPIYEAFKESINPRAGGLVDLKLSGGFQGNMFLKGTSFPFTVDSHDEKRSKLIEGDGYSEKVFGPNKPNLETIRQDVVKEDIQEYYKGTVIRL
jgi:hypothetical protein